jgi:acetyl esterase/lipase
MKSRFQKPSNLYFIPDAPPPTTVSQKLSHSMPLIIHLFLTNLTISVTICMSVIVHLFDGPLLESWDLLTSIAHSFMKALMKTSAPQGRHSMEIIRFATRFKFPSWIFNGQIKHENVLIRGSTLLSKLVQKALNVENITYQPDQADYRTIPGEWVFNQDSEHSDRVILYLHGGSHIFLSPNTHRVITTNLSKECDAAVFALDYRLAPEHPFPFAIEDALAAYLTLINSTEILGINTEMQSGKTQFTNIFIMGDSSGGCLVMQLVELIKQLKLPMPTGVTLLSPFLDHNLESKSWHTNWNTDFLSLDHKGVEWALSCYANGVSKYHPAVSPIYQDVKDYPPMLIQAGDAEVVMDDSIRFYQMGMDCGNHVELELYQDMFHVFQTFPFLPQSRLAFRRVGKFVTTLSQDSDGSQSEDTFNGDQKSTAVLIDLHDNETILFK